MKSRALVVVLPLSLAFALVPTAARAQPVVAQEAQSSVDQAKMYFSAGAQAFSAGQFEAAVQAFDEAYRLSPRLAILFSMAQAERRQFYADKRPDAQKRGIMQRAVVHYHQYLDKEPKSGRRAEAAQALAELEPLLAKLGTEPAGAAAAPMAEVTVQTRVMVSSQTKGAIGFIDGVRASDFPLIEEVTPGKHRVRVSAEGYFSVERVWRNICAVRNGVHGSSRP